MEPIRLWDSKYQSQYGKAGLHNRSAEKLQGKISYEKDSYNPKFQTKKKDYGVIATIGLMLASVFVAYKGHKNIKQAVDASSQCVDKAVKDFSKKHVNLAAAGSDLGSAWKHFKTACKSPFKGFSKFIPHKK